MATAHAKPHHEYHLVNPSPWPAVGATSAFVAAVGAIMWMHHMAAYAPLVLGAGAIGIAWWVGGATSSTKPKWKAITPAWCRFRTVTG